MGIAEELDSSKLLLVSIDNGRYYEEVGDIALAVSKKFKNTCFVTLSAKKGAIVSHLRKKKVPTTRFSFVEGSDSLHKPATIQQIEKKLDEALNSETVDSVIFDSMSALVDNRNKVASQILITSVLLKLRRFRMPGIFPIFDEDINTELVSGFKKYMDKVLEAKQDINTLALKTEIADLTTTLFGPEVGKAINAEGASSTLSNCKVVMGKMLGSKNAKEQMDSVRKKCAGAKK